MKFGIASWLRERRLRKLKVELAGHKAAMEAEERYSETTGRLHPHLRAVTARQMGELTEQIRQIQESEGK